MENSALAGGGEMIRRSIRFHWVIWTSTFVALALISGTFDGLTRFITVSIFELAGFSAELPRSLGILQPTLIGYGSIFTGFGIGIPMGILSQVVYKRTVPPESISSKKFVQEIVAKDEDGKNTYIDYLGTGITLSSIKNTLLQAHSGKIQFPFEGESPRTDLPPDLLEDPDLAVNSIELSMDPDQRGDEYQQGRTVSELVNGDNDIALPADAIITELKRMPGVTYFQVVTSAIENADKIRSERISEVENQLNVGAARLFIDRWVAPGLRLGGTRTQVPQEDQERIDRVNGSTGKTLGLSVRAINVRPKPDLPGLGKIKSDFEAIRESVNAITPEYVKVRKKFGSTASMDSTEQERVNLAVERYRNRELTITPYPAGSNARDFLVFDAETAMGLLTLPGAGRPETQQSIQSCPKEELPTDDRGLVDELEAENYKPQQKIRDSTIPSEQGPAESRGPGGTDKE
jgi:hypothetical protein